MDNMKRLQDIVARHQKKPDVSSIAPTVSAVAKSVLSQSSESERQAEAEERARFAKRQAEDAAMDRYMDARVPPRYQRTKTELRHAEWAATYETVRSRVATRGAIVVITGAHGTGKTHLACEVIRWACWQGWTARYETWPGIARRWREAMTGAEERSEQSIVADLNRGMLLVIDEIDIGKEGDFGDRIMRELIDRRYSDLLSTILVSNLGVNVLTKKLDPSVVSRMQETGGVVVCDWPSLRAGKAP